MQQGSLAALAIVRYPTLPSLEKFKNVDIQVGGRLFRQVPPQKRADLWTNLARKTLTGRDSAMRYPALQAQVANPKTCSEIDKDVPRTFPDVPGFNDSAGQRRLTRILRSYSVLDPEVVTSTCTWTNGTWQQFTMQQIPMDYKEASEEEGS